MKTWIAIASIAGSTLMATFPRTARADWTAHLDGGGGWSAAHGALGELNVRMDMVVLEGKSLGVGPALEMRLLHPGFGAGVVVLRRNDVGALTSTVVVGRDVSGSVEGAYVAGTLALGWRVPFWGNGVGSFSPSTAVYVAATRRLDGSDTQIAAGLQMGLGLTSYMLAAVAHGAL